MLRILRPAPRPSAPSPDATRYARAQYEWDDRYANQARALQSWKLALFVLLLINGFMAAALTWLGNSSKLVPYVVEVDKLGQAMAFGPAVELSRLDQRLYRFQLGLLVSGLRTIHPDRVSQRRSLQSAYAYLAEPAATYVANYFRDHNPFTATGAVTVQVTSVLRLGQDDSSWQVQWYEDHYATDGRKTARGYFQATLQVQLRPPKASEIPLTNPLGLYVTQIDWTQMPTTTMETPPP